MRVSRTNDWSTPKSDAFDSIPRWFDAFLVDRRVQDRLPPPAGALETVHQQCSQVLVLSRGVWKLQGGFFLFPKTKQHPDLH